MSYKPPQQSSDTTGVNRLYSSQPGGPAVAYNNTSDSSGGAVHSSDSSPSGYGRGGYNNPALYNSQGGYNSASIELGRERVAPCNVSNGRGEAVQAGQGYAVPSAHQYTPHPVDGRVNGRSETDYNYTAPVHQYNDVAKEQDVSPLAFLYNKAQGSDYRHPGLGGSEENHVNHSGDAPPPQKTNQAEAKQSRLTFTPCANRDNEHPSAPSQTNNQAQLTQRQQNSSLSFVPSAKRDEEFPPPPPHMNHQSYQAPPQESSLPYMPCAKRDNSVYSPPPQTNHQAYQPPPQTNHQSYQPPTQTNHQAYQPPTQMNCRSAVQPRNNQDEYTSTPSSLNHLARPAPAQTALRQACSPSPVNFNRTAPPFPTQAIPVLQQYNQQAGPFSPQLNHPTLPTPPPINHNTYPVSTQSFTRFPQATPPASQRAYLEAPFHDTTRPGSNPNLTTTQSTNESIACPSSGTNGRHEGTGGEQEIFGKKLGGYAPGDIRRGDSIVPPKVLQSPASAGGQKDGQDGGSNGGDASLRNYENWRATVNQRKMSLPGYSSDGRCSTLPSFQRSRTPRVADESSCQPGTGRQPAEEVDGTSIRQLLREDDSLPGDYDQTSIRYVGRMNPSKTFRLVQSVTGSDNEAELVTGRPPCRRRERREEASKPAVPEAHADDIVDISYVGSYIPSRMFRQLQEAVGDTNVTPRPEPFVPVEAAAPRTVKVTHLRRFSADNILQM